MRTIVRDERGHFDRQTRAYAEYRAFSSLTGSAPPIEHVTVTLRRSKGRTGGIAGGTVVCTIAVTTDAGECVEMEAVASHPYAAIDKAVALIQRAL